MVGRFSLDILNSSRLCCQCLLRKGVGQFSFFNISTSLICHIFLFLNHHVYLPHPFQSSQSLKSCQWWLLACQGKQQTPARAISLWIGGCTLHLFLLKFLGRTIHCLKKTFARKSNVNYHNEKQIDTWLKFEHAIFNFIKDTFGDDDQNIRFPPDLATFENAICC